MNMGNFLAYRRACTMPTMRSGRCCIPYCRGGDRWLFEENALFASDAFLSRFAWPRSARQMRDLRRRMTTWNGVRRHVVPHQSRSPVPPDGSEQAMNRRHRPSSQVARSGCGMVSGRSSRSDFRVPAGTSSPSQCASWVLPSPGARPSIVPFLERHPREFSSRMIWRRRFRRYRLHRPTTRLTAMAA